MVSGYTDSFEAEARQRLRDIESDIKEFGLTLERARNVEGYKKPSIDFYIAASENIDAIRKDIAAADESVEAHSENMNPLDYYKTRIRSLDIEVKALDDTLVIPSLTTPELQDVLSITGVVTEVEDGDTFYFGTEEEGNRRCFRMAGIDAAEKFTERGKVAKKFLEDKILGQLVECRVDPHQPLEVYGRILAVPFLGDTNLS